MSVPAAQQIGLGTPAVSGEAASGRILGYLVLRICVGLALNLHGVARIFWGHFQTYLDTYLKLFVGGVLPMYMVKPFMIVLPYVELVLGFLILVGLFTRWSLFLSGLTMLALLFGTGLRQDWQAAFIQLFWAFLYTYLLMNIEWNTCSLDRLRKP